MLLVGDSLPVSRLYPDCVSTPWQLQEARDLARSALDELSRWGIFALSIMSN